MKSQDEYIIEERPYIPQSMPMGGIGMGMGMGMPYGMPESHISNIVGQIDPKTIIDNLDHALKGEQWNKEESKWIMNASGKPLVNDACRGAVISYLTGILTNNTTMSTLDEKRLSFMMESVIDTVRRMFVSNLEEFGFVPKGEFYHIGLYYNKGTPDTARMTTASNMIFKVCFLVFARALRGQESIRIFKSLSLSDNMGYNAMAQPQKKGWISSLFS